MNLMHAKSWTSWNILPSILPPVLMIWVSNVNPGEESFEKGAILEILRRDCAGGGAGGL